MFVQGCIQLDALSPTILVVHIYHLYKQIFGPQGERNTFPDKGISIVKALAGFFNLGYTAPYTASPKYPPLSLWSENLSLKINVHDRAEFHVKCMKFPDTRNSSFSVVF